MNTTRSLVSWLSLALGASFFIKANYMDLKAELAQVLISSSWEIGLAAGTPQKPWWWADTEAIARLQFKSSGKSMYVMRDDSGESLAFGPGHLMASARVSTPGHVMIAGHRDTHFEHLQRVQIGDVLETQNIKGIKIKYRVISTRILDVRKHDLVTHQSDLLSLITCYPFDGFLPGGPLRYVVDAERVLPEPELDQTNI